MTPALDKPLPEFEALATSGIKFTPQAYLGQTVVLYFYPKDNTPGCTTEAMQFRDHHKEFVKAGAVVFGVSRDNMASHDKFRQNLELPFELIADTEEKLCHMFGVVKNKIMYGKKVKGIERSTFLIDGARHAAGRMARPEGGRSCRGSPEGGQVVEVTLTRRCRCRATLSLAGLDAAVHNRHMPVDHDAHPTSKPPGRPCGFFVARHRRNASMPLPKPPAKRAALLSAADFDSQAAPKTGKRSPEVACQRRAGAGRLRSSCSTRRPRLRPPPSPAVRRCARCRRRPGHQEPIAGSSGAGTAHRRSDGASAGAQAQAACRRAGQAVRARHQRADARPDEPVPLRGTRRLPADDHARGARRSQEGHDRGGAQRAPGQP